MNCVKAQSKTHLGHGVSAALRTAQIISVGTFTETDTIVYQCILYQNTYTNDFIISHALFKIKLCSYLYYLYIFVYVQRV